jgi:hypothetical protein
MARCRPGIASAIAASDRFRREQPPARHRAAQHPADCCERSILARTSGRGTEPRTVIARSNQRARNGRFKAGRNPSGVAFGPESIPPGNRQLSPTHVCVDGHSLYCADDASEAESEECHDVEWAADSGRDQTHPGRLRSHPTRRRCIATPTLCGVRCQPATSESSLRSGATAKHLGPDRDRDRAGRRSLDPLLSNHGTRHP